MKYIGVHSCDCLPEEDIGVKYFSTSHDKEFLKEQKEFPERFTYEVIMIWNTRREAMLHERFLLLTPNAAQSPIYYNLHNGGPNFDTSGRVTVKDKNGKTMQVSVDDERYLSGKLVHISSGKVVVKDKEGNICSVSKNDPRYISGELVMIWAGRTHKSSSKEKIGKASKERMKDPTNNSQFGTRWIYNLTLLENRKIKKTDCTPDGWSDGRVLDWGKKINEILAKKEKILEKENYDKSRQKLAEKLWNKFLLKEYKSIRQFAKNEYDKSFVSLMALWKKYIPEYHKIIIPCKTRSNSF